MNAVAKLKRLRNRLIGRLDVERLVRHGLSLGTGVHIGPEVILDPSYCWLITLDDECTLAPRVHVLAHDASTKRHLGVSRIAPVRIGRRAFIGAGTIVLPGVTIGDNAIIGAGSVVTRDVPNGTVAIGVPARIVGTTDEYIANHRVRMTTEPTFERDGWTTDTGITPDRRAHMRRALSNTSGYAV